MVSGGYEYGCRYISMETVGSTPNSVTYVTIAYNSRRHEDNQCKAPGGRPCPRRTLRTDWRQTMHTGSSADWDWPGRSRHLNQCAPGPPICTVAFTPSDFRFISNVRIAFT